MGAMKEQQFQTMWGEYLKTEGWHEAAVFELKIEKTHRFLFSKVQPHQEQALIDAETGLYHKIADSPIFSGQKTRFTAPKPFDTVYCKDMKGYVLLWYYVARTKKICYAIEINDFIRIRNSWKMKSIKEEELKKLRTEYSIVEIAFNEKRSTN